MSVYMMSGGRMPPGACQGDGADRQATDHRLRVYRSDSGDLMCLAHAGALSSEARVTASFCGTDLGCRGLWHCLDAAESSLVSKS